MREVSLLVHSAEYVITVDEQRRIYQDGAIAVDGDKILEIGKTADLKARYQGKAEVNAKGMVITPGLIDSHIHTAFQMSRGLADEVGAQRFLFERMYPYEGYLDYEDNYWSASLCTLELVRHGVTTFIDPGNYHPKASAEAIGKTGLRAVVAKSAMDIAKSPFGALPPAFVETGDEALARSEAMLKELHGAYGGRIHAWLSFRGVNNCSDAFIKRMKVMADHYNTGFQAHACFAKETRDASVMAHGQPEVQRLRKLDCLAPNLLLIHMGWAMPQELLMLRDNDVKVVAAPSSSMHNGYGNINQGHIPELLEMGVAVGLGSDHASSGIVDITQEMLLVAGGYKETRIDAAVMPPESALEMATINGARCCLRDKEVGSLEAGKKADMVLFNTRTPEWQPLFNPVSNLVYSAHGGTVHTVIIGGQKVVEGGKVLTVNEDEIYDEVAKLMPKILEKTGLKDKARSKWPLL